MSFMIEWLWFRSCSNTVSGGVSVTGTQDKGWQTANNVPSLWSFPLLCCSVFCSLPIWLVTDGEISTALIHTSKQAKGKTNTGKNQLLFPKNLIGSVKPLSWCKLLQVWVCPNPDLVSSKIVILQSSMGFFRRRSEDEVNSLYRDAFAPWSALYTPAHARNAVSAQVSKEQGTTLGDLSYTEPSQMELSSGRLEGWSVRAMWYVQLLSARSSTQELGSWSQALVWDDNAKGFRERACLVTQPDPVGII